MGLGGVAIALQLCTFNPSMSAAVGPAEARDSGLFVGALLPVPKGSRRMGGSRPLSMECPEDFFSVLQEQGLPPAYRYAAAVHQSQAALPAGPTGEQVRAVIVRGLAADPDLAFHLLPADEDPQAADGTRLFPPEEGEQVADHWIWYVHAPAFFPGPVWLLVPRNGKEPPYAYGDQ